MICTIRDVDCCAHTKSLLTQQFQSEAWDPRLLTGIAVLKDLSLNVCTLLYIHCSCTYSSIDLSLSFDFIF